MDKRYKSPTLQEQVAWRRKVVEDVIANPTWSPRDVVRHMRRTLRLTTLEMARLAKVSHRTIQQIESGRSLGTLTVMGKILGVLGLTLSVREKRAEERSSDRDSTPGKLGQN
jgi:DNA-binding XRE family transcriptional regulator